MLLGLVALPTAWVFAALVASCIGGMLNVGLDGGAGRLIPLVLLLASPAAVWLAVYRFTSAPGTHWSMPALGATAGAFPVACAALAMRMFLAGPFL